MPRQALPVSIRLEIYFIGTLTALQDNNRIFLISTYINHFFIIQEKVNNIYYMS